MDQTKERSRIESPILVNLSAIQFVGPRGPRFGSSLSSPAFHSRHQSIKVAQVLVLPW
jgi:hypothetical protein